MAGRFKDGLRAAGGKLLYLVELLALAFWIGGGLATGALTLEFLPKRFPEQAEEITAGVFQWLSITEIALGAAVCALIFILDRKRRKGRLALIGFVILVLATVVNQFILSGWVGHSPRSTIYVSIFFAAIALAAGMFAALVLAGRIWHWTVAEGPPAPAPAPPPALEPPAVLPRAVEPARPPAELPRAVEPARPPAELPRAVEPAPAAAPMAPFDRTADEGPSDPVLPEAPAGPEEEWRPAEDAGGEPGSPRREGTGDAGSPRMPEGA